MAINKRMMQLATQKDKELQKVLEDVKTGETIPIQRRGNLYIMQIWVRGSPDNRPPDPSSGFARRG